MSAVHSILPALTTWPQPKTLRERVRVMHCSPRGVFGFLCEHIKLDIIQFETICNVQNPQPAVAVQAVQQSTGLFSTCSVRL
jgi:hypothetical protein